MASFLHAKGWHAQHKLSIQFLQKVINNEEMVFHSFLPSFFGKICLRIVPDDLSSFPNYGKTSNILLKPEHPRQRLGLTLKVQIYGLSKHKCQLPIIRSQPPNHENTRNMFG